MTEVEELVAGFEAMVREAFEPLVELYEAQLMDLAEVFAPVRDALSGVGR